MIGYKDALSRSEPCTGLSMALRESPHGPRAVAMTGEWKGAETDSGTTRQRNCLAWPATCVTASRNPEITTCLGLLSLATYKARSSHPKQLYWICVAVDGLHCDAFTLKRLHVPGNPTTRQQQSYAMYLFPGSLKSGHIFPVPTHDGWEERKRGKWTLCSSGESMGGRPT